MYKIAQCIEYQPERRQYFCLSMVHIGKEIKKKADELRIGPTELGRRINKTKSNVRNIFERKSLDTDLLEMISKALGFDFFELYSVFEHEYNWKVNAERQLIVQEEKIQYLTKQNKLLTEVLDEERDKRETLLNKQVAEKEKLIDEQKAFIAKLEAEIDRLKKKKV